MGISLWRFESSPEHRMRKKLIIKGILTAFIGFVLISAAGILYTYYRRTRSETELLQEDVQQSESNLAEKQNAISELEDEINLLKTKVDSLK